MIGEVSAVATALLWSSSSILIKAVSDRMSALSVNALRSTAASFFVVATLFAVGKAGELGQTPLGPTIYLVVAVLIGMGLGDTLYFESIALVGVSRALTISYAYPLFTLPVALIFLGEGLTWLTLVGTVLVVAGVSLVGRSAEQQDDVAPVREQRFRYEGFLMALAAAACWAFSTSIQKLVLLEMDVFVANSIRTPAVALVLLAVAARSREGLNVRAYGWRPLILASVAGVISLGVGGLLFLLAVQEAGAAKAASLSAIAPIFAAPLSMVFLKERLTLPLTMGTGLSVTGVWLIILRG